MQETMLSKNTTLENCLVEFAPEISCPWLLSKTTAIFPAREKEMNIFSQGSCLCEEEFLFVWNSSSGSDCTYRPGPVGVQN